MPRFGSGLGADLVRALPDWSQERVQDPDRRPRGNAPPLTERSLPKRLQTNREGFPHPRCDVAVDAAHAGHLVAHAVRLQDVPNTQIVQPCLMTVSQAVRCQADTKRQPGGNRHGFGGLMG